MQMASVLLHRHLVYFWLSKASDSYN